VTFSGENPTISHLSQIAPVPQVGAYDFEYCVRSDGLTSDQTPYFTVEGYPGRGGAFLRSPSFTPSAGWTKVTLPLTLGAECTAVRITLRRDPSRRLDGRLNGTAWLDAIVLRPRTAEPRAD
jgi:hypothetical protein